MSTLRSGATLRELRDADLPAAGRFLTQHLNPGVPEAEWTRYLTPSWPDAGDVRGYLLEGPDGIVGLQAVFASERDLGSARVSVRNLGALCVAPDYRSQALRLVRAALGSSPDCVFTDLSPSGAVIALNERLGFTHLDTRTALVAPCPWPRVLSWGGARARVVSDPSRIRLRLSPPEVRILDDHGTAAAAHHVLLEGAGRSCYVMFRRDRRKGLNVFASILHVSDPEALRVLMPALTRHLLRRHRVVATLAELRIVKHRPVASLLLAKARPKMVRNRTGRPVEVDYLYSELTCVAW